MLYDCPFCHHQNADLYRGNQKLRNGGRGDVYMCKCGIIYPRPRMDGYEALDYLSKLHTNQENFHFDDPTVVNQGEQKSVKRWLEQKGNHFGVWDSRKKIEPKGKALDVGTFTGKFCRILASLGFEAYGLEPQEKASEFARRKGLKVFSGSFPDNVPPELQMRYTLISIMETIYYFVH